MCGGFALSLHPLLPVTGTCKVCTLGLKIAILLLQCLLTVLRMCWPPYVILTGEED